MIRINLLPVREARRKADVQQQLAMLGAAAVVAILGVTLFHWTILGKVSSTAESVTEMNRQIDQYKPQTAMVEDFRAQKLEMERKLNVIYRLDQARTGPVHMLEELGLHAPPRLWLTKLETEGEKLRLEGMSLDNEIIASFLTALNESPYFDKVELGGSSLVDRGGLKLNQFELEAILTAPDAQSKTGNGSLPPTGSTPALSQAPARKGVQG